MSLSKYKQQQKWIEFLACAFKMVWDGSAKCKAQINRAPFFIKVLLFLSFHLLYFATLKKLSAWQTIWLNPIHSPSSYNLCPQTRYFNSNPMKFCNPFQTQPQSSDQPLLLAVGEAIQLGPNYSGQINHGCNSHNYHQAFQNVTGSNTLRMEATVTS